MGVNFRGNLDDNIVMATKKRLAPSFHSNRCRLAAGSRKRFQKTGPAGQRPSLVFRIPVGDKAYCCESLPDFRVCHEVPPWEPGPVVLDHDNNLRLVEPHPYGLKPVLGLVEAVVEP